MSVDVGQREGSGKRSPNRLRPHQHTCTFVQISSFFILSPAPFSPLNFTIPSCSLYVEAKDKGRQRVRTSFPLRAVQQYVRN